LREKRVQILHTHTSKAGFIGRLAARLAGVPVVIHTPHGHIFYGYYGRYLTSLFVALERLAAPLADRIVTLTDREAEEHLEQGIGRPEQYVTIPSGVDIDSLCAEAPSKERAREELELPLDACIVIGLGRLVPIKGFDLLVRALPGIARIRQDVRLVLVGDGPERVRIEDIASSLGVGHQTIITGAHEQVGVYLAAADVLVAPSRNEGMGRSLVEAMALGLPTVAASVGGIPNVIEDAKSGILVPPEQPQAISEAVLRLLTDEKLHGSIGRAAREKARQFSLPVMESRLMSLYFETINNKNLQVGFEQTAN
jgi:glycosyltransferase involved in cell wall biosynthesis